MQRAVYRLTYMEKDLPVLNSFRREEKEEKKKKEKEREEEKEEQERGKEKMT